MMKMFLLAAALSWDSFVVGVVDGSFGVCGASKLRVAILFAFYDGTAAAVGLLFGRLASQFEQISAAVSFASWLILILLVVDSFAGSPARSRRWAVHLVPFLFCIDNLAAGPALASIGVAPAICFGLAGTVSGLFFFLGRTSGHCAATQLARAGLVHFRASGGRVRTTMHFPTLS
jgi:putative Mn2+ efflux pump MntP